MNTLKQNNIQTAIYNSNLYNYSSHRTTCFDINKHHQQSLKFKTLRKKILLYKHQFENKMRTHS